MVLGAALRMCFAAHLFAGIQARARQSKVRPVLRLGTLEETLEEQDGDVVFVEFGIDQGLEIGHGL
jgi:hypothetical protein